MSRPLLKLLIMVKNAGPTWERVLSHNLQWVDEWAILDTGSTDNTVAIARRVMQAKPGALFQEPFVDFATSRNQLIDLAGESCVFNIQLDDTYLIQGGEGLRQYLERERNSQQFTSFNVYIDDSVNLITSVRITYSSKRLRYIYPIHEVISNENNENPAFISKDIFYVEDLQTDDMKKRSSERSRNDVRVLTELIKKEPDNPRFLFYLANSYGQHNEWENALYYYKKRAAIANYSRDEEKYESMLNVAIIAETHIKQPWPQVHELFLEAYNWDPRRFEALYGIGIHYHQEDKMETAFLYFLACWNFHKKNGSIEARGLMNHRHNLIDKAIPTLLQVHSFLQKDWALGKEVSLHLCQYAEHRENASQWYNMFQLLEGCKQTDKTIFMAGVIVFIVPGNWEPWYGLTLEERGLGGSESSMIHFAEEYAKVRPVVFFCNTPGAEKLMHKGVLYCHIDDVVTFLNSYIVETCVVSRVPYYAAIADQCNAKNIYVFLHEINPVTTVFLLANRSCRAVYCFSGWQKRVISGLHPAIKDYIKICSHGVDVSKYQLVIKKRASFIYPSFPDRGLLILLRDLWPRIIERHPDATLTTFCRFDLEYMNGSEMIAEIQRLLVRFSASVVNRGWVKPVDLAAAWCETHIWLHPAIVPEIFGIVSIESAASKTIGITPGIGAFRETNKCIVISGDPSSREWQNAALDVVFRVLGGVQDVSAEVQRAYNYAASLSYENVTRGLIELG